MIYKDSKLVGGFLFRNHGIMFFYNIKFYVN